jgi:alkanesulfonate monooxygenase SsuD/methylene tetrahydromethanopterin reductase-like flavin-dependent oxidoreductase (luciferase family)
MTDSRSRFEAWLNADCNAHFAKYEAAGMAIVPPYRPSPEEIWQAAERETARRCVDHINGLSIIGDRSAQMIEGIKAEFPGAWE